MNIKLEREMDVRISIKLLVFFITVNFVCKLVVSIALSGIPSVYQTI